jgi:arginase
MCLTLGGDHSIGVGTIHGVLSANQNTSVLWIDAHADLNTPLTSPSGNVHGMPVSFCLTELLEYHCQFPEFDWHKPNLSARNIAFIGLRDVDPYER